MPDFGLWSLHAHEHTNRHAHIQGRREKKRKLSHKFQPCRTVGAFISSDKMWSQRNKAEMRKKTEKKTRVLGRISLHAGQSHGIWFSRSSG